MLLEIAKKLLSDTSKKARRSSRSWLGILGQNHPGVSLPVRTFGGDLGKDVLDFTPDHH
jgi:hypothetical protein